MRFTRQGMLILRESRFFIARKKKDNVFEVTWTPDHEVQARFLIESLWIGFLGTTPHSPPRSTN